MNPPREVARVEKAPENPAQAALVPLTPGAPPISERWARAIATHQHRVVLSLVGAGFSFDRASDLANEAWARLMEKDRAGTLGELKLPGLAIVQARYLAWDERRGEAGQRRHHPRAAREAGEALMVERGRDPRAHV